MILKNITLGESLDATKLSYHPSKNLKPVPAPDSPEVQSRNAFTDHMITVKWTLDQGWLEPQLVPYGPLQLQPSASVLQYATTCFEGMKVFRGYDGKLRLFRPDLNCQRMARSAQRISLPAPEPEQLLALIQRFCTYECPKWLPRDQTGSFLYLRPTLMGTDCTVGPQTPKEAILVIFGCYWPIPTPGSAAPGLKLLASRDNEVRAWPNGTGFAKIGANYGPALLANSVARDGGYDQVLWLLGPECHVTEAGATNFFVIWRDRDSGMLQLVTPPLDDGVILAGITRQSVLDLARERFSDDNKEAKRAEHENGIIESLEVIERPFTMSEIIQSLDEDRLQAAFSVGTACFVSHVSLIHFRGRDLQIPAGRVPHLDLMREWLCDIMYGKKQSEWTRIVEEE